MGSSSWNELTIISSNQLLCLSQLRVAKGNIYVQTGVGLKHSYKAEVTRKPVCKAQNLMDILRQERYAAVQKKKGPKQMPHLVHLETHR